MDIDKMNSQSLNAKTREVKGKKVDSLRKQGQIPAVLYGHGVKEQSLVVEYMPFEKVYHQAGESTLVDLKVDSGEPVKVLIHQVQFDPITSRLLHIDFFQVRMDEKLRAHVALKFINEAPAVKELNGVFVKTMDEVEIECLPKDLIHEIEVDISSLKNFDEAIKVADLPVPSGIKILNPADESVALVQEPRSEKELESLTQKPVEDISQVEPVKPTPEAAAEGETAKDEK